MADRAAIEDRLGRIEARQSIEDMLALYARGADRKNDPVILGPLFAPDAIWEAEGFGRFEGRETIAATLARLAETQIFWSFHYMVSPLIDLDIERSEARCRWYLWELATMLEAGVQRDNWLCGSYDSRLRCIDGRWQFTHVVLDLRLVAEASPPWAMKKTFGQ